MERLMKFYNLTTKMVVVVFFINHFSTFNKVFTENNFKCVSEKRIINTKRYDFY